jgi:hypothetical protein
MTMTTDEILRVAAECQLVTTGNRDGVYAEALVQFAHLVRQQALEEAAGVCAEVGGRDRDWHAYDAAAAIRALKEKV